MENISFRNASRSNLRDGAWISNMSAFETTYNSGAIVYLDVFMVRQARRNAGQSVVIQVQLSQMWHVS